MNRMVVSFAISMQLVTIELAARGFGYADISHHSGTAVGAPGLVAVRLTAGFVTVAVPASAHALHSFEQLKC